MHDRAGEVHDRAQHRVDRGEVDGHDVGAVDGHPDQRRRLADARLDGRTELLDEALGQHLADQVGHGDPGEPAGAGEVGATRGAAAEQVLQQHRAVVAPGVLLAHLALGAQALSDGG